MIFWLAYAHQQLPKCQENCRLHEENKCKQYNILVGLFLESKINIKLEKKKRKRMCRIGMQGLHVAQVHHPHLAKNLT